VSALRHNLFLYGEDGELARGMGAFLAEGLDAGETVAVVATPAHRSMFEDELTAAREQVVFMDPHLHYTRPEAAIASYDGELRRLRAGGATSIRIYAELPFDLRQPGPWDRWMSYEAIFTHAFAHHPLFIVCGYDRRTTPPPLVDDLRRSHPEVMTDTARPSADYADPREVVRALARPPRAIPELPLLDVNDDQRVLRSMLMAQMTRAGVADDAARDGLIAVNELLVNANRHAGGLRELRAGPVGERFVVELSDDGGGYDDPLAGYVPPRQDQLATAGLWVARQLSADLELLSSSAGLTARVWI
jgi:anti-sigma regulatory factor (Ser/Thr protein kinase)